MKKNNEYDRDEKRRHRRAVTHVWLAIGVVVLIMLLLLWVDVVDIAGAGDGSADFISLIPSIL